MKVNVEKMNLLLAKKGMLLKNLCEKSGVSEITLRKIRQGKSTPKPVTVGKIAKALNVNVEDIIVMHMMTDEEEKALIEDCKRNHPEMYTEEFLNNLYKESDKYECDIPGLRK